MKIHRLYIKMFVSFIVLLFIAEALILLLFRASVVHRSLHDAMQKMKRANLFLAQELVNSRIRGTSRKDLEGNRELHELVRRAGFLYKARIWIDIPGEKLVIKSFDGEVPDISHIVPLRPEKEGPFRLFHDKPPFHLRMPIRLHDGKDAAVFAVVDQPPRFINESIFITGLFGIGLVIALLMIPLFRFISVPVRKMSSSALRIADGDLKERISATRKDEIGDLGRAFNLMADRIETMIGSTKELAVNISHELRSPLARIAVALEVLLKRATGGSGRDIGSLISSIQNEVVAMDHLIGRILLLSRLDLHEQAPRKERANLVTLTSSILEQYDGMIREKCLTVSFHRYSEQVYAECVRDDMQTALTNIIDNAVKYTPEKGSISISLLDSQEGIQALFRNTFDRFSPDDLERIFVPFYRAPGTEKKGTGLGLAITKKIIVNMGGSIHAAHWEKGFELRITLARQATSR